MIFADYVVKVLKDFENQTFQADFYRPNATARIKNNQLDSQVSEAVFTLFCLGRVKIPEFKSYKFFYETYGTAPKNGTISLRAPLSNTNQKVRAEFMKQFKSSLCSVAKELSTGWKECLENDPIFTIKPLLKGQTVLINPIHSNVRPLYEYLNQCYRLPIQLEGDEVTYLVGTQEKVDSFLNYIKVVGENIEIEIKRPLNY